MNIALVLIQLFACLLLCDFLTGVLHWAEDTYGHLGMSEFARRWVVADNIMHHAKPGVITQGSWWECNRVCIALSSVAAVFLVAFRVGHWQAWVVVLIASHSNQVHAWAHQKNVPLAVNALQRFGVFQDRWHHAQHHQSPYAVRFCTMTNFLNPVLDTVRFWRALEFTLQTAGLPAMRATSARGGY